MGSLSLITVVLVVGLTEFTSVRKGKGFKMEPVIAGFILGILLFALDSVNQKLSRSLCGLIILVALIYNSASLSGLLGQTKGKTKTTRTGPRPGGIPKNK
jgi:hypothetical protein